jgi:anti-sigma B factor antagonist
LTIHEDAAHAGIPAQDWTPFAISTAKRRTVTILSVCGEIDLLTINSLRQAIDDAFDDNPASLLVDLTRTTFLAAVGLKALEQAQARAEASGAMFAVATAQASTSCPITALHLERVLDLHATVDEVIEMWSRPDVRWPAPSPLDAWWIEVMSPETPNVVRVSSPRIGRNRLSQD